ncbi:MAG: glycoside hydrolase [Acidobacteriaceae bacterium]|nr:glycoside hydrolase [Acidobacteriaceae bacterium]
MAAHGSGAKGASGQDAGPSEALPGIWQKRFGTPEQLTPVQTRTYPPAVQALHQLPPLQQCPVPLEQITGRMSKRGYEARLPLAPGEMIYGLGLQFQSVLQRGRKKTLRVNADPVGDAGDSHAPVPFYVSNLGYGVLIDTARYLTIYCGGKVKKDGPHPAPTGDAQTAARVAQLPKSFERYDMDQASEVLIEVPEAQGVDLYIFGGPTIREAVQRYNLFSGGGPLLPRWGLGFWYRVYGQARQEDVLSLADELRTNQIPCDVLGLEPGWQSHSYSCSFTWSDKFPDPDATLFKLKGKNFHVNLWEHAFTHPTAPFHKALFPYSGNYEVWGGLVPDFLGKEARTIFGDYHEKALIAHGVSGFKLDECDNSDFTRSWSFPELSRFPSGADGEQMHCFFGLRYQDTIQAAYQRRGLRTLGLVRSSHALAAPSPYVLYSDLYDHHEFIRGVVNAGFCGLLWCPEVRDAKDPEDLIRRLQTTIFSPLAMVNAWYIRNPPWKQVDREQNDAGHFAQGWAQLQATCKRLIETRMQFVPYLYSSFVRYHQEGIPPFRALVMDYPDDPQTWAVDDQYLMGENILVAPVVAGQPVRDVYLPRGTWFDFWTGKKMEGGRLVNMSVPLEQIPVFIKSGTLLPLAVPSLHTAQAESFQLNVRAYGPGTLECSLHEDDGSLNPEIDVLTLTWAEGQGEGSVRRSGSNGQIRYSVQKWERRFT